MLDPTLYTIARQLEYLTAEIRDLHSEQRFFREELRAEGQTLARIEDAINREVMDRLRTLLERTADFEKMK